MKTRHTNTTDCHLFFLLCHFIWFEFVKLYSRRRITHCQWHCQLKFLLTDEFHSVACVCIVVYIDARVSSQIDFSFADENVTKQGGKHRKPSK